MSPSQATLTLKHTIKVEKEGELGSKENEAKPQDGEKLSGELQEECEEKRARERETAGSEGGNRKKNVLVGFAHKGSLILTNPYASALPSIDPSYVQVQVHMLSKKDQKGIPHDNIRNELVTPLAESSKQVDCHVIHRVALGLHSVEKHESFLGSSLVAYVGQFALKDISLLDHVSDVIQNPQVSIHSCNIDHDIEHISLSLCDANCATSFAQGNHMLGKLLNKGATLYLLVYGTEAVIPAEVEIPSLQFIVEVDIDDDEWVKT
ncbi:hypothetical protein CQW23_02952 [Capsicum baccatum]|uniref:Uncharacterized protein n=1 Tax=Capsicum baccatum TaxID=33114 RepID=A0A2G2XT16_CAPBA|nr:hypothetical protein CQW23_02952 [Capsicum baccatum]